MKNNVYLKSLLTIGLISVFYIGCAKEAENLVTLDVNVSWNEIEKCSNESPEIKITNLPEDTSLITVSLNDINVPSWNHGGGTIKNDRTGLIKKGALKSGYNGPCPPFGSHKYVYEVKAINSSEIIVGKGNDSSMFPLSN